MNRRQFFVSAPGLGSRHPSTSYAAEFADEKPLRVGLIGCGWYGKCDLFRLIQVSPVESSRCAMSIERVGNGGAMVGAAQASKKTPRLFGDYREMLKEEDSTWSRSPRRTTGMRCR